MMSCAFIYRILTDVPRRYIDDEGIYHFFSDGWTILCSVYTLNIKVAMISTGQNHCDAFDVLGI